MNQEAERIMLERFGGDAVIALSTLDGTTPYVRFVNAHYENGAFYVITHALSNKMRQIRRNPDVADQAQSRHRHRWRMVHCAWACGEPGLVW